MHSVIIFETSRPACKSQPFTRFWRKLSVISLLLEEFRRLNVFFIALYTPNVILAIFNFETRAAARKSQSFPRFWRKLSVIFLLLEEFLRLNATLIAFYTRNVVHAVFSAARDTAARKS